MIGNNEKNAETFLGYQKICGIIMPLAFSLIGCLTIIRTLWMNYPKVTGKQIFDAYVHNHQNKYIASMLENDKERYMKIIEMLDEQGPMTEEEVSNSIFAFASMRKFKL